VAMPARRGNTVSIVGIKIQSCIPYDTGVVALSS
jgi:hypothetical protein